MKQKAVSEEGLWRGKKGILGEDRSDAKGERANGAE